MADLVLARNLALYLLSFFALASAEIAWRGASPLLLFLHAMALAAAFLLGQLLDEALSGVGAAAWRRRARLLALGGFALAGFVAVLGSLASPQFVIEAVEAYAFLQPLALLLAEFLALQLAALVGALVLVVLAAIAGGLSAEVAVTGFVALLAFFLAFDHSVLRLQGRPPASVRLFVPVARDAARTVGPVLGVLAAFLWLVPATPPAELLDLASGRRLPTRQETRRAYEWLALLGLAGAGLVFGLGRLFRGGGESRALLEESVETQVESEEMLEPPSLLDPRYGAARGRVIRAYLRVLARARAAGLEIAAQETPREIEARLRPRAPAMPLLTGIFMDARYGPDEPSPEDVREAEGASQELVRALPARRRRSARPPLRARD
jgi:hypothetical protein